MSVTGTGHFESITEVSGRLFDLDTAIDSGGWSSYQKLVVALTAVVIVLDGVDTQIIGFAAPALMTAWRVSTGQLAPLLAIGLAGMLIGNAVGGVVGDRIGRRWGLIASVLAFGAMTVFSSFANDIPTLLILRFIAGIGLGVALPNAAALAAEFTPHRYLSLAVTATIVCGYLGGFVGGGLAALLLPQFGWRVLFMVAGVLPLMVAAVLIWCLPESPRFLVGRPRRWSHLREIARRCGLAVPADVEFVRVPHVVDGHSIRGILSREFVRDTLAVWLAFFFSLSTVYLSLSWLPSVLKSAGHSLAAASAGLMYFNLGSVLLALLAARVTSRLGSRIVLSLMAIFGSVGAVALAVFPLRNTTSTPWIALALAFEGGCIGGLQTTLYSLSAHIYPTRIRATGVGTAATMGRVGAVLVTLLGANILAASGGAGLYLMLAAGLIGALVGILLITRHIAPEAY